MLLSSSANTQETLSSVRVCGGRRGGGKSSHMPCLIAQHALSHGDVTPREALVLKRKNGEEARCSTVSSIQHCLDYISDALVRKPGSAGGAAHVPLTSLQSPRNCSHPQLRPVGQSLCPFRSAAREMSTADMISFPFQIFSKVV